MLVLARWAHFSAMVTVFGVSFFWLYMGPRRALSGLPETVRMATRIVRVAAPLAALSEIVWLMASIANMTGDLAGLADGDTLHAFFLETPFGAVAVARLTLLVALVVVAHAPIRSCARFAALAVLGALLLVSQAWLGHAAEGGATLYGAAMIAAYAVHVLAGAAWLGGLPVLLLAIAERTAQADTGAGIHRLLARYSAMAVVAVSAIVLSGTANTAFRVGDDLGALLSSAYGEVLLVKLGLVSVLLVLAAFNRLVMMPRMRRVAEPLSGSGALTKSIMLECVCGLAVLAAAAVLGVTPPPR